MKPRWLDGRDAAACVRLHSRAACFRSLLDDADPTRAESTPDSTKSLCFFSTTVGHVRSPCALISSASRSRVKCAHAYFHQSASRTTPRSKCAHACLSVFLVLASSHPVWAPCL
eukprot:3632251-Pleurochrysis_carterae.AAC.1